MEIPSAINSGLQGLQNARAGADEAALEIARSTTPINEQTAPSVSEVNTEVRSPATDANIPDLNKAVVDLKVAEYQAKASTEVIKSADDSLGTLLDVTA